MVYYFVFFVHYYHFYDLYFLLKLLLYQYIIISSVKQAQPVELNYSSAFVFFKDGGKVLRYLQSSIGVTPRTDAQLSAMEEGSE